MSELNEKLDCDNLTYHCKNKQSDKKSFNDFYNAVIFLKR